MAYRQSQRECFGCPHMNMNDPRCARHFSLSRLSEAFTICLNGYEDCPTYYQIRMEHAHGPDAITTPSLRPAAVGGLRPTG